jgi:hypothetical protein
MDEVGRLEVWERQPGEPNRWFARFEAYRLLGPSRSLLGAVNDDRRQRSGARARSVPQAWAKNAKAWRWRERAEAWDDSQRRAARAAREKEIDEMNHRQVQEARALQSVATQRLRSLDRELLSPADVLRYFTESARLERLALGVSAGTPEQQPAASTGSGVTFSIEDAVRTDRELEAWERDQLHRSGGAALPGRDPEMP